MPEFISDGVVELGNGVRLRSVDVSGQAQDARRAPTADRPVRDAEPGAPEAYLAQAGTPPDAASRLGTAVTGTGMRLHTTVELPELIARRDGPSGRTRAPSTVPHLELEVDAPVRTDEAQVVMEVDGTGHVRWHFPRDGKGADGRRGAVRQHFDIPVDQFTPHSATAAQRGIIGFGVRKVLHVVRFPVEQAAGWVAGKAVGWWEERNRPYRLHLANPDGSSAGEADANRLVRSGEGPFLLFVHGAFSTGAGFGGLHGERFGQWHREYGGRVLVFDHPTMHVGPEANAAWLLGRLPTDRSLTLDVVTHSRGGLVGRQLPRQACAAPPTVRRLVQVAVPNAGTTLAGKDRLGDLLDTFTNLLSLLPDGSGGAALEAVLELVKQVALGALSGLDGLTAMDPANESLKALNDSPVACDAAHAITTDYEPHPSASLAAKAMDTMVDALFGGPNDLVVPTDGMARAGRFVVANPFVVPGSDDPVAHSTYFGNAAVQEEIARCLALPATVPFR